jgi:hypothetical protein
MDTATTPDFPIRIDDCGRRFADRSGRPFLYHADTGWQMFSDLTLEEAGEYLDDRRAKRFTTIQAQIVSAREGPTNRYGDPPFLADDLATPNEAYFAHADRVVRLAREKGLLLVLSPLWLCYADLPGSGLELIRRNGPRTVREYGRYIGRRYGHCDHLMWIVGGDRDPLAEADPLRQLAEGLKEGAPAHLLTYHASSTHSSTDVFGGEEWLDFSMTYTYYKGKGGTWVPPGEYPEVYEVNYSEYRKGGIPFVLGEAMYEGYMDEEDDGTAHRARKQAYWSVLSGAAGHAYGSRAYAFGENWREDLQLPGARHMRHLYDLLAPLPWHDLEPDLEHDTAVDGYGAFGGGDYVTTARTRDGTLAMSYLPRGGRVRMDLGRLAGPVSARWYDPTSGTFTHVGDGPLPGARPVWLEVPRPANAAGDADWVLVLAAER